MGNKKAAAARKGKQVKSSIKPPVKKPANTDAVSTCADVATKLTKGDVIATTTEQDQERAGKLNESTNEVDFTKPEEAQTDNTAKSSACEQEELQRSEQGCAISQSEHNIAEGSTVNSEHSGVVENALRPQTPSAPRSLSSSPPANETFVNPLTASPLKASSRSPVKAEAAMKIDSRQPQSLLGSALSPVKSSQRGSSNSSSIKVVLRIRPITLKEKELKKQIIVRSNSICSATITPPVAKVRQESRIFYFDQCIDGSIEDGSSQVSVYQGIGKDYLDHNLEGYNTCIFAYGQTGSGKTYTMMGSPEDPGIIPRTCTDLFSRIDAMSNESTSFSVRVSYFEIYNENVHDLLSSKRDKKMKVRESKTDGPYVENLSEFAVKNVEQVMQYVKMGSKHRVTASTKMNETSSRSHAVLTLILKRTTVDDSIATTQELVSHIRLVDLAGSEKSDQTGATGQRLVEGNNINKSLTTLGRVISCLAAQRKGEVVPYRDSTLTWLLKDSLGGNSKTAMMACISPTDYEESKSTLRYADQAKQIKTRAVVNEENIISAEERDRLLVEMQERINALEEIQNVQSTSDDNYQIQLDKVKQTIRFYEDQAHHAQSRHKAIQEKNLALARDNKLLREYLKDVTGNRNNAATSSFKGTITDYEELCSSKDSLMTDLTSFRNSLRNHHR